MVKHSFSQVFSTTDQAALFSVAWFVNVEKCTMLQQLMTWGFFLTTLNYSISRIYYLSYFKTVFCVLLRFCLILLTY